MFLELAAEWNHPLQCGDSSVLGSVELDKQTDRDNTEQTGNHNTQEKEDRVKGQKKQTGYVSELAAER